MKNKKFHFDENVRINNQRCAAIIIKDHSLLFMHRIKDGKDFYVLIGGHMQKGEEYQETVKREIWEEASITVRNIKPAFDFKDYIKDNYDYYFICNWEDGDTKLGGEELLGNCTENMYSLEWIKYENVYTLNILPKAAKEWILESVITKEML